MLQSNPISQSLGFFLAAGAVMYGAMRLLWAGFSGTGLQRGLAVSLPMIFLAMGFTFNGDSGFGVAILLTTSVFMLMLGVGVIAINATSEIRLGLLRLLIPLALLNTLIGFHGTLTSLHGLMLLAMAGLTFWSASPGRLQVQAMLPQRGIVFVVGVLLLIGCALVAVSADRFQSVAGSRVLTPLVVLIVAPVTLFAMLGVLGESQGNQIDTAVETIVGFGIGCLGFGQAAVIGLGHILNHWPYPKGRPSSPVTMALTSWRLDSVMLVVLLTVLLPAILGRMKLGRVEGAALVLLYLIYASVAAHTANLGGG